MDKIYEIFHEDAFCNARTGVLHLPHKDVLTPVFMPVGTLGTVKAVTFEDLKEIGFEIILSNTYHLNIRPGIDIVKQAGGLHGFTSWNRNFLTDSGGFQVFSLAHLSKITKDGVCFNNHINGAKTLFTPESTAVMQSNLNSDIQMQLDVCTPYGISYDKAKEALEITLDWGKRAKKQWFTQKDAGYLGSLFAIVQGNFFCDLRKISAQETAALDTPGIAIGGLSVGETCDVFCDLLSETTSFLPKEKPRYVMGIGTPQYLLQAIECGIDMADCVLPTRNARNGSYLTHCGALSIKQERFAKDNKSVDPLCDCKVCRTYPRSYLRHLFKSQEILSSILASYHNLYFLHNMIKEARLAIQENRFTSFKKNFIANYESNAI